MSRDENSIFRFGVPDYRDAIEAVDKKNPNYKLSQLPMIKKDEGKKPEKSEKAEKPEAKKQKKAPTVKAHILELLNSLRK